MIAHPAWSSRWTGCLLPSTTEPYQLEIKVDGHFNSKVYTTGSSILGQVVITPRNDIPFSHFEIVLEGTSTTRANFLHHSASQSSRTFLRLAMPICRRDLPESQNFAVNQTYTMPFTFVIPRQLTTGVCKHKYTSSAVRHQHSRPPPTIGSWENDDQASDCVTIEYAVKVRASNQTPDIERVKVMEASHPLKVIPALEEDPPLHITSEDKEYRLSRTKSIHKSILPSKLGKLKVSAAQPGAIIAPVNGRGSVGSKLSLSLAFTPLSKSSLPPSLNRVVARLESTTYYSLEPMESLPDLGDRSRQNLNPPLPYSATKKLDVCPVGELAWRSASTLKGKDTTFQFESDSGISGNAVGHSVCSIDIPFTLPDDGTVLLPTFHSCLVSRTYKLRVSLSFGPAGNEVRLVVPVQVAVSGIEEEVDEFLPEYKA